MLTQTVRTANAVRSHLERVVLREARLSWSAFDLLTLTRQRHLAGAPVLELREAARVMAIAKSTMTVVVQTLAERQLLHREFDRSDRRRALLRATPAGLLVAERLLLAVDAEQERLFDGRTVPGHDHVVAVLRTLAARCANTTANKAQFGDNHIVADGKR